MIIRTNIDWLSVSIVNIPLGCYDIFDNFVEFYGLEKQDYLIRNCYVAINDYMNFYTERSLNYINIELKPLFFWRYLPELIFDENYYINYIVKMFDNINYKLLKSCVRFNRVDIAIDYIGNFYNFDETFISISEKKLKSLETIRNIGKSKNGLTSYLNGNGWHICRYEKTKELLINKKTYYPEIYEKYNVIRTEIRISKEYLKNYDKTRQKFFYLFKKLINDINDKEFEKIKIKKYFENIDNVKSIKNNIQGEYMLIKEKIINEIISNIEKLNALENVYHNKNINIIDELIEIIKNKYKPEKLKKIEYYYKRYLNKK